MPMLPESELHLGGANTHKNGHVLFYKNSNTKWFDRHLGIKSFENLDIHRRLGNNLKAGFEMILLRGSL